MTNKIAIPQDIYDADGNMLKIEFHDEAGDHIIDVVWDFSDEQTSENRIKLREFAYRWMRQQGWNIET
jgi:hypothetical protein